MSTAFKRRSLLSAMLAALFFAGTLITPGAAHAIGMIWLSHYSAQADEVLKITPDSDARCPSGYSSEVFAQLIDDEQSVYEPKIATSDSNGYWGFGVLTIPEDHSPGNATLRIVCKSASFGTTTASFDQSITIFAPANEITVDRAQFGMTSTFSSLPGKGCGPNEDVWADIYSTEPDPYGTGMAIVASVQGMPDSGGNWALQVQVDNTNFDANKYYFFQAYCGNGGIMYYSYKFIPRWNEYVALGDSYSSGEGSYNYNLTGGACHRSTDGYPHYLSDVEGLDLPEFQACSGAVTDDFYVSNPNRPGEVPQLERLNEYTQTVTLTIGGNDMGFKQIAEACAHHTFNWGYSCEGSTVAQEVSARLAALEGIDTTPGDNQMVRTAAPDSREIHPIAEVLDDIATEAYNAKIYIAGYPELFGSETMHYDPDPNAPGLHTCLITQDTGPTVTISYADAQYLNGLAGELNEIISSAVTAMNNPDVVYVDPFTFTGHGHCDALIPWFNGVDIVGISATPEPESLHPNVTGMQMGYGDSFSYLID